MKILHQNLNTTSEGSDIKETKYKLLIGHTRAFNFISNCQINIISVSNSENMKWNITNIFGSNLYNNSYDWAALWEKLNTRELSRSVVPD